MNRVANTRRYEIDWIRNISILLLFVYHTSVIFCRFGDFYIISDNKSIFADIFILAMFVWYMPLLFFLAGASTHFALQKRDKKEYLIERIKRLLIPFIFGIIVIVPPQTYLARLWRGEVDISYLNHLKYFFTNIGDFSGFDGKFTPAHLWFILYLFIISLIGVFIVNLLNKNKGKSINKLLKQKLSGKFSFLWLLVLSVIADIFPSVMGKSIVTCLLIFILGFIVYKDGEYLNMIYINKNKYLCVAILISIVGAIYTFYIREFAISELTWLIDSMLKNSMLIVMIITIVGYGMKYLNKTNKVLMYLNKASFPVYIIHQTVLLGIAYFIIPKVAVNGIAIFIIIVLSIFFTFLIYEICKRNKIISVLLGIK